MTDSEAHRVLTAIDLAISVFRTKSSLTADQERICHDLASVRRSLHSHYFSSNPTAKKGKAKG